MSDLSNTPLTEAILQKCFKSKTYVRDSQFDILWYLGGKNNVTIGEKSGKFYLIPAEKFKAVIEMLPQGIIQVPYTPGSQEPTPITTLADLLRIYPELTIILTKYKL